MDRLEEQLRDELSRRVATPPYVPNLADTVVRRGRRAKQRRALAAAGAAVAVVAVVLASTSVLPSPDDRPERFADLPLEGPPRVPMFVDQTGELIEWVGGEQRSRQLGELWAVAQVPAGLLVVMPGERPGLGLLGENETAPRPLVEEMASHGVAVSDDGRRAAVVAWSGPSQQLQEVDVSTGAVLRTVLLARPDFSAREPVVPVAYSGGAVLITAGEGPRQRAVLWESGEDAVVAQLDGFRRALGGADADFSDGRDAVGGRGAFDVDDDRCRVEVHQLRNGDGDPWQLCRENFVSFSPSGEYLLATDAVATGLVVHDAGSGDVRRTFQVPDYVSAASWESEDAVLYTTASDGSMVVVRCSVSRNACATAAEFPYTDRVPRPVPQVG